jgi:hypothetical protein
LDRAKGLGLAAHASTSGPASGDARHRYDAVAWEGAFQSLSGGSRDSVADMLAVLATNYSVIRRVFSGKVPQVSHPLLNRAAAISSYWHTYAARHIVGAGVCALGSLTELSSATRWPGPSSTGQSSRP